MERKETDIPISTYSYVFPAPTHISSIVFTKFASHQHLKYTCSYLLAAETDNFPDVPFGVVTSKNPSEINSETEMT